MKKVLVVLTDDLAKELAKSPNMSHTVREALKVYNGDISTDTIQGLRESYKNLQEYMETKFNYYDLVFKDLEKLINVLETRM